MKISITQQYLAEQGPNAFSLVPNSKGRIIIIYAQNGNNISC